MVLQYTAFAGFSGKIKCSCLGRFVKIIVILYQTNRTQTGTFYMPPAGRSSLFPWLLCKHFKDIFITAYLRLSTGKSVAVESNKRCALEYWS
jgi:hypothetical protein